jgi:hypothetical protein
VTKKFYIRILGRGNYRTGGTFTLRYFYYKACFRPKKELRRTLFFGDTFFGGPATLLWLCTLCVVLPSMGVYSLGEEALGEAALDTEDLGVEDLCVP